MKSPDEIINYLAFMIGEIYVDPPVYGSSGICVNEVLRAYHEVFAEIVDRRDQLKAEFRKVLRENPFGTAQFPKQFALSNPSATEEEIIKYVVAQWQKVSERIGVPLPNDDELRESL